jgi:hypothetical protein
VQRVSCTPAIRQIASTAVFIEVNALHAVAQGASRLVSPVASDGVGAAVASAALPAEGAVVLVGAPPGAPGPAGGPPSWARARSSCACASSIVAGSDAAPDVLASGAAAGLAAHAAGPARMTARRAARTMSAVRMGQSYP